MTMHRIAITNELHPNAADMLIADILFQFFFFKQRYIALIDM